MSTAGDWILENVFDPVTDRLFPKYCRRCEKRIERYWIRHGKGLCYDCGIGAQHEEEVARETAGWQTPAAQLYRRFVDLENVSSGAEIAAAAEEMRQRKDLQDELYEHMRPRREAPRYGATGAPLMDLTGGRVDTPEWIGFCLVANRGKQFYDEYLDWVRRNRCDLRRNWFLKILIYVKPSFSTDLQKECEELIGLVRGFAGPAILLPSRRSVKN